MRKINESKVIKLCERDKKIRKLKSIYFCHPSQAFENVDELAKLIVIEILLQSN